MPCIVDVVKWGGRPHKSCVIEEGKKDDCTFAEEILSRKECFHWLEDEPQPKPDRVKELSDALEELITHCEAVDSWEYFPALFIDKARKVLEA